MLTKQNVDAAAAELGVLQQKQGVPKQANSKQAVGKLSPEQAWARKNLRFANGQPHRDLANVIRILERHEDYNKRFKYNEVLTKVLDKGTVMLQWRVSELTADIQERFLPAIEQSIVEAALIVSSNRAIQKKD